jgi:hypothetical protein
MPNQFSAKTQFRWLIQAVKSHNSDECLLWARWPNDSPISLLTKQTVDCLPFHGRYSTVMKAERTSNRAEIRWTRKFSPVANFHLIRGNKL